MKRCSKCKENKSKTLFSKDRTKKDGFHSHCKECNGKRKSDKEYQQRYRENNREKAKEYSKEWYKNNPDKIQRYLKSNEDILKAKRIQYNKKNRKLMTKKISAKISF